MTIAIQGDWGSGKTSMMNMIKQAIAGKIVPILVQYMAIFSVRDGIVSIHFPVEQLPGKDWGGGRKSEFPEKHRQGRDSATKTAVVVGVEQFAGGTIAGNFNEQLRKLASKIQPRHWRNSGIKYVKRLIRNSNLRGKIGLWCLLTT